jgi:hypothetical protein
MYGHLRSNDAVEIICEQGDAGSVEPYAACLKSPSDRFIASRRLSRTREPLQHRSLAVSFRSSDSSSTISTSAIADQRVVGLDGIWLSSRQEHAGELRSEVVYATSPIVLAPLATCSAIRSSANHLDHKIEFIQEQALTCRRPLI